MRLDIAKKLLLGYLPAGLLTIAAVVYAWTQLGRLNDINAEIVQRDLRLIQLSDEALDNLLAQELFGRRYLIVRNAEMLDLFHARRQEVAHDLSLIAELTGEPPNDPESLAALHGQHTAAFLAWFDAPDDSATYDGPISRSQEALVTRLKDLAHAARRDQDEKTKQIAAIGAAASRFVAIVGPLGLLLALLAAAVIARNILRSIRQLKRATAQIAEGNFDHLPDVDQPDELGDLSRAFSDMATRLQRLEQMYLDSSPLTHLPGGVVVETALSKRIASREPFAFCLFDLDNFKALNDRYGYSRGNTAITTTAHLIEEMVERRGTGSDFVGHIGGDDFVVLTTPDAHADICNGIVEAFDRVAPSFYDPEDRERGFIEGKTRRGELVRFPMVSISIAAVTTLTRHFADAVEVSEVAAELKEYAKSRKGSVFVTDRRRPVRERHSELKLLEEQERGETH